MYGFRFHLQLCFLWMWMCVLRFVCVYVYVCVVVWFEIFLLLIHSQNRERSLYLFPPSNQGFTRIFSFFFLETKSQKCPFFNFPKIKSHSLSFFLLQKKVSNNVLFLLFLFLCQSSSLLIEQVMSSEICEVFGVDWSCYFFFLRGTIPLKYKLM